MFSRTLFLAILCPSAALAAAPVFTGDVQADFTGSDVQIFTDPGVIDVGLPVTAPTGTISGFDMRDVRLHYDPFTDTVTVGIDTFGIAGDADGNGDPNATSAWLNTLGGVDLPNWGGTESFSVFFDIDQDGAYDVIVGLPLFTGIAGFQVATFNGTPLVPGLAFGAPLPGNNGGLFATPSAAAPDIEFKVTNWSSLPHSSAIDGSPSFTFGTFLGSLSDGGIGEDFNPGQGQSWTTAFPRCGDGFVQVGEVCDDGNSVNTDACTNTCELPICGDTFVQAGEQCDDGNSAVGDGCDACAFEFCGDNVVQPGETCDDGNDVSGDGCDATCEAEFCGDGVLQAGEQCDDGNFLGNDGCSNTCAIEVCGDGVRQTGEQCDDGNTAGDDGCSAACRTESCGDGVKQITEQCDDANNVSGDGCNAACRVEFCGDGTRQGAEQCDDGNNAGGDGCSATCVTERCGDGIKQGAEQCDDGNAAANDGCTATCRVEICGDGIKQALEQCDDGNLVSGDGCTSTCRVELCGDGVKQGAEQCDDGNTKANDGCSATCRVEGCGDGIKQACEQCDDGNLAAGDGCSNTCRTEYCGDRIKQGAEQCDDGNSWNNDGCTSTCRTEFCGDGVKQSREACDDGNTANLDGCSSTCTVENLNTGCTSTTSWWKSHNKYARSSSYRKSWPISEDTRLLTVSWYSIINSSSTDTWYLLAQQWVAATLNEAGGASVSPTVAAAMDEAETILLRGSSSCRSGWNRTRASQLTTTLSQYNGGQSGPAQCVDNGHTWGGGACPR